MPIYEYRCGSCRHEFESIQKMSDDPLLDCPQCGRPELKKLISASGFRLKGGGWYETDFKQNNRKNVAEDKKSDTASSKDTPPSGASESKTSSSDSATTTKVKSADGKAD